MFMKDFLKQGAHALLNLGIKLQIWSLNGMNFQDIDNCNVSIIIKNIV